MTTPKIRIRKKRKKSELIQFSALPGPRETPTLPSVGVLKWPGFLLMPYSTRQRLKKILLDIAEDPLEAREKRMEATEQVIDLIRLDDMRHRARDKAKLLELRRARAEKMQDRLDRKAQQVRSNAHMLPPKTPENALGIGS